MVLVLSAASRLRFVVFLCVDAAVVRTPRRAAADCGLLDGEDFRLRLAIGQLAQVLLDVPGIDEACGQMAVTHAQVPIPADEFAFFTDCHVKYLRFLACGTPFSSSWIAGRAARCAHERCGRGPRSSGHRR